MSDRIKEHQISKLKARLDDLDNQTEKIAQDQLLVCDHLRKLKGKEELLGWLEWRYVKSRIEHDLRGQGRG